MRPPHPINSAAERGCELVAVMHSWHNGDRGRGKGYELSAPTVRIIDVHRRRRMDWKPCPKQARPKRTQNMMPAIKLGR